uniref:tetratricopeptide repeat protein n=1 Tax=Gelidibacter sp. TaxID=2018083 RepID=UPI004049E61E
MKALVIIVTLFASVFSYAQEKDETQLLAIKKANDYVYEGNEKLNDKNYISAEKEYRKAMSQQASNVAGAYNLGNSFYKKGNFEEALYRQQQAAKNATSKEDKHKAFHNIGNILMQNKQCKEAVEAFKNALRNNPKDDETRYNYALAKQCADQQKEDEPKGDDGDDKDKDKDKDKQDQDKDQNDKKDQDKKDGDDKKDDEGKPKDDKQDKGKDDKKDQQQKQPQPGQLSPQQIKNLLEAMNNQEQKVQEKMNADKQKGVKVKTEKDW